MSPAAKSCRVGYIMSVKQGGVRRREGDGLLGDDGYRRGSDVMSLDS